MNFEQAKAKLASVSDGTAVKHPKVLISELCLVIKFLIDELENEKTTMFVPKQKMPSEDVDDKKRQDLRLPWINPCDTDPKDGKLYLKKRTGNAGDAE